MERERGGRGQRWPSGLEFNTWRNIDGRRGKKGVYGQREAGLIAWSSYRAVSEYIHTHTHTQMPGGHAEVIWLRTWCTWLDKKMMYLPILYFFIDRNIY